MRNLRGEGTRPELLPSGLWRIRVDLGSDPDTGKRRRKTVTGRSEAEVLRRARKVLAAKERGEHVVVGQAHTVASWLRWWVEDADVRPTTRQTYTYLIDNYIVPSVGRYSLAALRPEHVRGMHRAMREKGLAPATIRQAHAVLRRALKVAEQYGNVSRNVARLVDAPSVQREEVEPLTEEEARRVLEQATSGPLAARWTVALALGLRQGEALGLRWDDIDFEVRELRVRRQLQRLPWKHGCGDTAGGPCGRKRAAECPSRHGGGLVESAPKSRAGRRTVAVPGPLLAQLEAHRVEQARQRLICGPDWHATGYVFTQPNGKPIDPRSDNRAWHELLDAAGVPARRLHDARHTAASLLLAAGVPLHEVSDVLGHSGISITNDTYGHLTASRRHAAADAIARTLWS